MMKWLPTVLTLLVLVAGAVAQPVQDFVSLHPMLALVLGSVYAMLKHFLPSPVAPKKPEVDL